MNARAEATSRACGVCGAGLAGLRADARFCSPRCRSHAHRRRARGLPVARARAATCGACGETFRPSRRGHRWCSEQCRMAGRRLRQLTRSQGLALRWGIEPKDFWRTPPAVFAQLDVEFRFGLDAAAAGPCDAKVAQFLTPAEDGLTCRWRDFCHPDRPAAFCNPPYSRKGGRGRGLLAWVEAGIRARNDGLTVVFVVPPAPSTQYHRLLHEECPERRIYDGRLSFVHPDTGVPVAGNRGDTMVAVLRPGLTGPATPTYIERPPC